MPAFNARSSCSASIQTPEKTQCMSHNQHNSLKIILQVVEDSKLIEGSSIIWGILAQRELFQLQGSLTQESKATLQKREGNVSQSPVLLKFNTTERKPKDLIWVPKEHNNPPQVLFLDYMAHACLQSNSEFHQKCEILVRISRQFKLLRCHTALSVSGMLACLNATVQITNLDQILRFISSKLKIKIFSYPKHYIQTYIK